MNKTKNSFDNNWEQLVYKKKLQINKYPFDKVISLTNNFLHKSKIKKLRENALELGCGTGNNLNFLKNFGFQKVFGIEGSKSAVKVAKANIKSSNIKIIEGDFINIPFNDKYFKLCLDRGSITHNKKKEIVQILNEVFRCLKKDGIFISFIFSKLDKLYGDKIKKKKRIKVEQELETTFLSFQDVKKLYSKFKVLDITHDIEISKTHKITKAMWVIVAKKK